jgi:hypothetical protein
MSRPRWLDPRVIGGVLLLVASVVIGVRVVGSSSHTAAVWASTGDLAVGTVLADGDLTEVDVNLGDAAGSYLAASVEPVGRVLNRPVARGDLVPVAALSDVGEGRVVAIAVTPDRMAPGVTHGSVVDVYLISGGSAVSGSPATTSLIKAGVTVQSVTAPASGGLSGATSSRYQVALLLAPADADQLVRSLPKGEPMIVLETRPGP